MRFKSKFNIKRKEQETFNTCLIIIDGGIKIGGEQVMVKIIKSESVPGELSKMMPRL